MLLFTFVWLTRFLWFCFIWFLLYWLRIRVLFCFVTWVLLGLIVCLSELGDLIVWGLYLYFDFVLLDSFFGCWLCLLLFKVLCFTCIIWMFFVNYLWFWGLVVWFGFALISWFVYYLLLMCCAWLLFTCELIWFCLLYVSSLLFGLGGCILFVLFTVNFAFGGFGWFVCWFVLM